ncbi:MAG: 4'-phosphopantetheinyl transferase superfamily protein, partial [Hungatella sp.]|nr:4'-phosphopantetheinyl transferase superfamily protein [Hungatella sp.]
KNSVHFNLSHSGKYILLGLDHHPIGVDIEKIEERNYLGIAKLYFHIDEYNYLMNLANPKEQKIAFFRLWVMKESYLKAGGYGFHYPVNALNVLKEKECHIKNGLGFNDYQFFVKEFIDSYVAGVYSHKEEKVQLTEIQFDEVVQFFI